MGVRIAIVAVFAWADLNGCSSSSPQGGEGQTCFPNDTCNVGLTCASKRCMKLPTGSGGAGGSIGSGGAGGSAARGAGAGGATAGAGGSLNCNVTASYGPITFASSAQQAMAYADAASDAIPGEVDWDALLTSDAKPDVLGFSFASGLPPFTNGVVPMDAIDLTGQDDYRNCGACVVLIAHSDQTSKDLLASGDDYIATSGTLKLTATPTFPLSGASHLTGTLTNVVFKHVKIDSKTFITTDVDACKVTLTSATFDSVVTPGM